LRSEAAPADLVDAVRDRWSADPPTATAAALAIATLASESAARSPTATARDVERAWLEGGARIQRALRRLGLAPARAAALCLDGVARARRDPGTAR
jgi:hypothetical protein